MEDRAVGLTWLRSLTMTLERQSIEGIRPSYFERYLKWLMAAFAAARPTTGPRRADATGMIERASMLLLRMFIWGM